VRLALARFQPVSEKGAHLSRVLRAEFAQLSPDRTASVAVSPSVGGATVNVLLKGPTYIASRAAIALDHTPSRGRAEVEALVQKQTTKVGGGADLGWETLSKTMIVQSGPTPGVWQGTITVNEPLVAGAFRLLLQEFEWHRSDYGPEAAHEGQKFTRRLVYVDAFDLA
jgi:hypothetical protein